MTVRISRALRNALLARAAASPGIEVCGLLLGRDDSIETVAVADNVADDPAHRFEVDPRIVFAANRAARAGGPPVIGHYHSHPNGRAEPSPCDAAAAVGGELWLILAGGEARLFRAVAQGPIAGRFEPVDLMT